MRRLIEAAQERGVRRLMGQVLAENAPMLQLIRELGFALRPTDDLGVLEATLDLAAGASPRP